MGCVIGFFIFFYKNNWYNSQLDTLTRIKWIAVLLQCLSCTSLMCDEPKHVPSVKMYVKLVEFYLAPAPRFGRLPWLGLHRTYLLFTLSLQLITSLTFLSSLFLTIVEHGKILLKLYCFSFKEIMFLIFLKQMFIVFVCLRDVGRKSMFKIKFQMIIKNMQFCYVTLYSSFLKQLLIPNNKKKWFSEFDAYKFETINSSSKSTKSLQSTSFLFCSY